MALIEIDMEKIRKDLVVQVDFKKLEVDCFGYFGWRLWLAELLISFSIKKILRVNAVFLE